MKFIEVQHMSGEIVAIRADVIEAVSDCGDFDGTQLSFRDNDGKIVEEIFTTSYEDVIEALALAGAEIILAG